MELQNNKELIATYKSQAAALVAQMTLEEKVSQTLYNAPAIPRLGIPAYNYWNEALHGVARAGTATVFPQAIAMAAAFDEDMLETVGDAVSTEARAKYNAQSRLGDRDIYKGLTFWSPNVNLFRDPRWGRGHETFGEDPYLTSRLGVRYIAGLQGHDPAHLKTAACAKHFAVHSGPEALRHEFNAEATPKDLYESYLPAFRACVQEGHVESVMGAYNRTNGVPCCGNPKSLTTILRDTWGFDGHVTSDFMAIPDFHQGHHVTENEEDSAALAMNSGCDLDAGNLYPHLVDAVRKGKVSESRLDEALVRLFTTRIKLGIMGSAIGDDESTPYDSIPYSVVDSAPMKVLNREVSLKCPVLLKNDGILPLNAAKYHTIGVIGPNANSRAALVGNYEGTASRYVTILEGIQDIVSDDCRVLYAQGCTLYKDRTSNLSGPDDRRSEAAAVCEESDLIIAVMGLDPSIEGEEGDAGNEYGSGDKRDLYLPGLQQHILDIAVASGKPVVLITLAGSALALDWADQHVNAIVHGWYPGALGGWAIAQLLFGKADFQGRLPVTFYSERTQLPDFTDYHMEGRTYRFLQGPALYPFGYGLSYTRFHCSDLVVTRSELHANESLPLQIRMQNMGDRDGVQTLQVYVGAEGGTPNPQLKAIRKVSVAAGEDQLISMDLPYEAFAWVDESGTEAVRPGTYHVYIGGSQPDERSTALLGEQPLEVTIQVL